MIQRQVTATPVDTFAQPSQAGVLQADAKVKETQRFFRNMGAFTEQQVELKRDEERKEYDHKLRLQERIFKGNMATMNEVLKQREYRDASLEDLMETDVYKETMGSLNGVIDKKAVETMETALQSNLKNINDIHTADKENETMDSLVFEAFNKTPDGDEYDFAIEDAAKESGYARTYDVAADEAIAGVNLTRAKRLFDKHDPRMAEETKARLLSFITQQEAAAATGSAQAKADIGRLKVHMKDIATRSPAAARDIGLRILQIMEANGDVDKEAYGSMQGQIDLLSRDAGAVEQAQVGLYQGGTADEIAADYNLKPAYVKEMANQAWARAEKEFAEGNTQEMERLLQGNPDIVADNLKATITSTMSRLNALGLENIDKIDPNDFRVKDLQKMMQIADMSNDTPLKTALGGQFDDFHLIRADYKAGGFKFAMINHKKRQEAKTNGQTASSRHTYQWPIEKRNMLDALVDDMPEKIREDVRSFASIKAEALGARHNIDDTKTLLEEYIMSAKSVIETDDGDVPFAKGIKDAALALGQRYEVDESELYNKFKGYVLQDIQKTHPTIEGIQIMPSPVRQNMIQVYVTDGVGIPSKQVYSIQELTKMFVDNENTKLQTAEDNVRG